MSPVCLTVCDCGVFLGTCADARSECGKASIPSCRYATHVDDRGDGCCEGFRRARGEAFWGEDWNALTSLKGGKSAGCGHLAVSSA